MVRAGVDPGLLYEVSGWRTDDLWFWALQALVTYISAAGEHAAELVSAICGRVASRYGVQLAAATRPARQNAQLELAQNIGLHRGGPHPEPAICAHRSVPRMLDGGLHRCAVGGLVSADSYRPAGRADRFDRGAA